MITTQGHQVGVLPQFQAPNPALLAFNPQEAQQGALGSLQISSSLEQIKALRQHTEEIAKMSNARNKLLEAQQRLAEINAKIAEETAAGQIKSTNALSGLSGEKAKADLSLLGQRTDLDRSVLAGQASRQSDVNTALAEQAKSAALVAPIVARTAEQKALTEEIGSGGELNMSFAKVELAKQNFQIAKKESDFALKDFDAKKIRESDYQAAKTKTELADAELKSAQAEFARARDDIEAAKIKAKNDSHVNFLREFAAVNQSMRDASSERIRLLSTPVPNINSPGAAPMKLAEVVALAFEKGPNGEMVPKSDWFRKFTNREISLDQITLDSLKQLDDVTTDIEMAREQKRHLAGAIRATSPLQAGASPKAAPSKTIPAAAKAQLKANPGTSAQFDEIFGKGEAAKILGK